MRLSALVLAAAVACVQPPAAADGGAEGTLPAADAVPEVARPPLGPEPTATLLERHDFERRTARFDLPGRLDEISGLAFSPDGRLFAHDDERGRIHEIDPASGEVGKRWDLGDDMARDDFEGMAIVGERFFLVSSRGLLYEFREAGDREETPYRVTDTGVGADCEVEGLEHDPGEDALLLACKVATPDRGAIVVYRIPLDPARPRLDPLFIPRASLASLGLGQAFDPSGIALDPTGSLVLVSARQEAIIEVDRGGRVLSGRRLSRSRHPQAEGVAFGPDGTLYLADERNGRAARLTAYARIDREGDHPG